MTHKLIEAATEAVVIAKCDHSLTILPRAQTTTPPTMDRYACSKCQAVIWVPIAAVDTE